MASCKASLASCITLVCCKASHWLLVGFSLASFITLASCKASHWLLVSFSLASSRLLIGS